MLLSEGPSGDDPPPQNVSYKDKNYILDIHNL